MIWIPIEKERHVLQDLHDSRFKLCLGNNSEEFTQLWNTITIKNLRQFKTLKWCKNGFHVLALRVIFIAFPKKTQLIGNCKKKKNEFHWNQWSSLVTSNCSLFLSFVDMFESCALHNGNYHTKKYSFQLLLN